MSGADALTSEYLARRAVLRATGRTPGDMAVMARELSRRLGEGCGSIGDVSMTSEAVAKYSEDQARDDNGRFASGAATFKALSPAARKWLGKAVEGPIFPTYGPYTQLRNAGLVTGPQDRASITELGRHVWSSANSGKSL